MIMASEKGLHTVDKETGATVLLFYLKPLQDLFNEYYIHYGVLQSLFNE